MMVSSASAWSAQLAPSLLRKLDAKTFRGDVSQKIQVHSTSARFKSVLAVFVLCKLMLEIQIRKYVEVRVCMHDF
jgi:hypothetical protein